LGLQQATPAAASAAKEEASFRIFLASESGFVTIAMISYDGRSKMIENIEFETVKATPE